MEKNYSWKKINFFLKSKTTIYEYLSLSLHKERPSYRRSLQLSKEAIQHFKTWTLKKKFYFNGSFVPSWIRIRIRIPNPDPDPLTRLNPDPIRIRICNPASGSYLTFHPLPPQGHKWSWNVTIASAILINRLVPWEPVWKKSLETLPRLSQHIREQKWIFIDFLQE
jgi:hypothetical protein